MAKTVTALKDILQREEKVLEKIQAALPIMAHPDTKAFLKEAAKNKRSDIRNYKRIITRSEKCPAIKKPSSKGLGRCR